MIGYGEASRERKRTEGEGGNTAHEHMHVTYAMRHIVPFWWELTPHLLPPFLMIQRHVSLQRATVEPI